MNDTKIGEKGAEIIAYGLSKSTKVVEIWLGKGLHEIKLGGCELTAEGARALGQSLCNHPSLKKLYIGILII